jgi:hypothetical protein
VLLGAAGGDRPSRPRIIEEADISQRP